MALELGCTVDELKERMTAREFMDWLAYYDSRPFGQEWVDVLFAVLSANIYTAFTGKRQDPEKHRAKYKKPRQKMTRQKAAMWGQLLVAIDDQMAKRKHG